MHVEDVNDLEGIQVNTNLLVDFLIHFLINKLT